MPFRLLRLGKFLALLALLLAFPAPAAAEAKVPVALRVRNRPPGYCVWCCLEAAGKHQGWGKEVAGLADWYAARTTAGANDQDAEAQLTALGVRHERLKTNDRAFAWLFVERFMERGKPVVVGLTHWKTGGGHAVLVTDVSADWVRFADPNCPEWDCWLPRAAFDAAWHGWAVAVLGKPK